MKMTTQTQRIIKPTMARRSAPRKKPVGKFFRVNVGVLEKVKVHAARDTYVELIMAYLVLCKHRLHNQPCTTAGAPAIAKVLGMGRYRAGQILNELKTVKWGKQPDQCAIVNADVIRSSPGKNIPDAKGLFSVKGLPGRGEENIYLPNDLLTPKNGRESPLGRLLLVPDKTLRFDAFNVLMACYAYQDVEGSGGLDPRHTFCEQWTVEGTAGENEIELGYYGHAGLHYFLMQPSGQTTAQKSFIKATTDGKAERFFAAIGLLRRLGFLVPVAMVFDCDPMASRGANVLYPLYVFDRVYRMNGRPTGTGGLSAETLSAFERALPDYSVRYSIFSLWELDGDASGAFVMAAPTREAVVLTVFRLRFSPHDSTTARGFFIERQRAEQWKERLQSQ